MKLRSARSSPFTRQLLVDRVLRHGSTHAGGRSARGPTRPSPTAKASALSGRSRANGPASNGTPRPRSAGGRSAPGADYKRERPHASLGFQPPLTRLQRAA
jgi:hypothetical protein